MTGYERQEENGTFWTIDARGDIFNCYDINSNADKMYNTANYYSDKTVAQNNARADSLIRQLRRFAAENNEEEINWHNIYQNKYYITYGRGTYENGYAYEFIIDFIEVGRDFGQIYFTSRATAQKAINTFRNELIWYFTEYCDHIVEDKNESDGGCELCKSGNLDNVGIGNNRIWFCGGNTKPKDNEKVKFCPKCGRKLVSENDR